MEKRKKKNLEREERRRKKKKRERCVEGCVKRDGGVKCIYRRIEGLLFFLFYTTIPRRINCNPLRPHIYLIFLDLSLKG